jgi:hypothetical protein
MNSKDKFETYLYDSDNQKKALSPDYGDPGPYANNGDVYDTLLPYTGNIEYSARKLSPGERLRVGLDIEEVNGQAFSTSENLQVVATTDGSQASDFPPNTHD